MVFYFTATGNSLYVAKQLDEERLSIPQEMNRENRHYKAERIGIVCPLFEFEIPPSPPWSCARTKLPCC